LTEKINIREQHPSMIKLRDDLYAIKTKFLFHIYVPGIYCYLLINSDSKELILFDTGGPGSGKIIKEAIESTGYSLQNLKAVLISHWHKDHTGGLAELISMRPDGHAPVRIFAGNKDLALMKKRTPHQLFMHPFFYFPILHRPGRIADPAKCQYIPLPDNPRDNPLAEWGIDYIPTPGHTPGHTSYLHKKSSSLFPGCALSLLGKRTVGTVNVFWRRKIQIESAEKLAKMKFSYLYPVHFYINRNRIERKMRGEVKGSIKKRLRIFGSYPVFSYKK